MATSIMAASPSSIFDEIHSSIDDILASHFSDLNLDEPLTPEPTLRQWIEDNAVLGIPQHHLDGMLMAIGCPLMARGRLVREFEAAVQSLHHTASEQLQDACISMASLPFNRDQSSLQTRLLAFIASAQMTFARVASVENLLSTVLQDPKCFSRDHRPPSPPFPAIKVEEASEAALLSTVDPKPYYHMLEYIFRSGVEKPSRRDKLAFAARTGLPYDYIQVWFQNRRSRGLAGGRCDWRQKRRLEELGTDYRQLDAMDLDELQLIAGDLFEGESAGECSTSSPVKLEQTASDDEAAIVEDEWETDTDTDSDDDESPSPKASPRLLSTPLSRVPSLTRSSSTASFDSRSSSFQLRTPSDTPSPEMRPTKPLPQTASSTLPPAFRPTRLMRSPSPAHGVQSHSPLLTDDAKLPAIEGPAFNMPFRIGSWRTNNNTYNHRDVIASIPIPSASKPTEAAASSSFSGSASSLPASPFTFGASSPVPQAAPAVTSPFKFNVQAPSSAPQPTASVPSAPAFNFGSSTPLSAPAAPSRPSPTSPFSFSTPSPAPSLESNRSVSSSTFSFSSPTTPSSPFAASLPSPTTFNFNTPASVLPQKPSLPSTLNFGASPSPMLSTARAQVASSPANLFGAKASPAPFAFAAQAAVKETPKTFNFGASSASHAPSVPVTPARPKELQSITLPPIATGDLASSLGKLARKGKATLVPAPRKPSTLPQHAAAAVSRTFSRAEVARRVSSQQPRARVSHNVDSLVESHPSRASSEVDVRAEAPLAPVLESVEEQVDQELMTAATIPSPESPRQAVLSLSDYSDSDAEALDESFGTEVFDGSVKSQPLPSIQSLLDAASPSSSSSSPTTSPVSAFSMPSSIPSSEFSFSLPPALSLGRSVSARFSPASLPALPQTFSSNLNRQFRPLPARGSR